MTTPHPNSRRKARMYFRTKHAPRLKDPDAEGDVRLSMVEINERLINYITYRRNLKKALKQDKLNL
jgi:hypothetical protein